MKNRVLGMFLLIAVVTMAASHAMAEFQPLFQVIKITGECNIQRPDDAQFSPAEESKAYPYGTKIKTGMRSSLVIVFSEGNVCRVLANADIKMDEGITNKKLKIIRLNDGEVEVELKEDFHKDGNALNVETASAICGAIGCKFRVASKMEDNLQIIIVRVIEGLIKLQGEDFSIAELDQDDWISLLSPPDKSFLRLKTMKGEFKIVISDENHQPKDVPTEEGTVLKIWQKKVPGTNQRVVTAVLTAPDGQMIETVTVTYTEGDASSIKIIDDEDKDWKNEGDQGENQDNDQDKDLDKDKDNPDYDPDFDPEDPDPDPGQDEEPGDDDLPDTPTEVGKR